MHDRLKWGWTKNAEWKQKENIFASAVNEIKQEVQTLRPIGPS